MASHERKLSTALIIAKMTYSEINELWVWMVSGVWVWMWWCGGYGSSSDVSFCFFVFFSFLLIYFFSGSLPGTNSVSTGFYHLQMEVEFPRAPDPLKGQH